MKSWYLIHSKPKEEELFKFEDFKLKEVDEVLEIQQLKKKEHEESKEDLITKLESFEIDTNKKN